MQVVPLSEAHLSQAAELFAANFRALRQVVPALPDTLAQPDAAVGRLRPLAERQQGLAAVEAGRLEGYLAWVDVPDFRHTGWPGAYCPEWGHAARPGAEQAVYRGLYRAAAEHWTNKGCRVHALSLLAHNQAAQTAWFWQGFGLTVVDAIRPIAPLGGPARPAGEVRLAEAAEAEALARLDDEHWQHYTRPPVLMVTPQPASAGDWTRFLAEPPRAACLALAGGQAVGFLRFEPASEGAVAVVEDERTIAITGAYVAPEHRGQGLGRALLDAGLRHFAAQGYARCSVDFEGFNPEAASFWPRYFDPVCLSVTRWPESVNVSQ